MRLIRGREFFIVLYHWQHATTLSTQAEEAGKIFKADTTSGKQKAIARNIGRLQLCIYTHALAEAAICPETRVQ